MERFGTRRTISALALTVALAGCGTDQPSPAPSASPVATVPAPISSPQPSPQTSPQPSPALMPTPAPVQSPAPSPWTSTADTLAWHRIGAIPRFPRHSTVGAIDGSPINGLVGFSRGYVALDGSRGAVWHSPDGEAWTRVSLPMDGSHAGASDANGLLGRAIATNGRTVIVVGGYSHAPCGLTDPGSTGGGPDCSYSPIAWVSRDGLTWRVVYPDAGGELVAVWPVAGGWVAAASDWYGESLGGRTLWASTNGVAWERVRPRPPAAWEGYDRVPLGVGSGSAQSLLAANGRGSNRTTLATTSTGGSWSVLDGFPGRRAEVVAGVAPTGDRTRWLLGGRSGATFDCEGRAVGDECWGTPTIWSSAGGANWSAIRLPIGEGVAPVDPEDYPVQVTAVTSLVLSERGYVAVGAEGDKWVGARHETWVSDDGIAWTRLPGTGRPQFDYGPGLVADGPAGVIGISGSESARELVVWQLR